MKVTCPRCGGSGHLEEHWVKTKDGREYGYWRVVHYYREDGKTRKRVCYLGPIDREYIYVEKVHRLALTNILHQDPSKIISNLVSRVIDAARAAKLRPQERARALNTVRKLLGTMRELLQELESVERELQASP
jgi:hypothetical protein